VHEHSTHKEQLLTTLENQTISSASQLDEAALDLLFREARSFSFWQPRPVEDSVIRKLYDLLKFGPTSANTTPARFVFVTSNAAKARLVPLMPEMNREKTASAPVVVLVAYDLKFYEKLDKLMPHRDYKPWFVGNPAYAEKTAKQSGTLQGAYLMLAARSLGLDCGPMLGNDDQINVEFFPDSSWRLNFVCALGYGVKEKLFPRLPRLDFDEAALIL
jgi:3-hydroxypropanoate dehydrogenase